MSAKSLVVVAWAVISFLWAMNVWGGWAEQTYVKLKGKRAPWYWLTLFGVEKTQANCVKFIKSVSTVGIILFTIFAGLILWLGK